MPPNRAFTLEICVDSLSGLRIAQAGADRIELCAGLDIGGLTPSCGMIKAAAQSDVPVHVLIRPRAGDFSYDDDDISAMATDIAKVRDAGLAGVVLGASRNQSLDYEALRQLVDAATGLEIALHRVVDCLSDPLPAIDIAVELGISRILSSGGAPSALDGVARLRAMHRHAEERIEIMAGGGVTPDTLPLIARATGLRAFHASARRKSPAPDYVANLGFGLGQTGVADAEVIAALRKAINDSRFRT